MAQRTKDSSTLFERFSNLMDGNTKGAKLGCYTVAFIGLTYAIRKVRPFSRFKRPSDVPKHFIKERRELAGTVERIEPNGALLMVNHKPLVALPWVSRGELPVKIAGINVGGHGISWLQTLVAGNNIVFTPLSKMKDFVECEVKMAQYDGATPKKKKSHAIDLGEALVSVGFGDIIEKPFITKKDPNFRYYMHLKVVEDAALKKHMGMKYYIKPTGLILAAIARQLQKVATAAVKRITSKMGIESSKVAVVAAL